MTPPTKMWTPEYLYYSCENVNLREEQTCQKRKGPNASAATMAAGWPRNIRKQSMAGNMMWPTFHPKKNHLHKNVEVSGDTERIPDCYT